MKVPTDFQPERYGLTAHYRPRHYAQVWKHRPADWKNRLTDTLEQACGSQPPTVFFRADDVGAGGRAFQALCNIFREHRVPVAMAVVPAWLSSARIRQLFQDAPAEDGLWGWHQHGWRHVNWQRSGKKSEFGRQRPFEKQWRDIWQGRQKMHEIFGDDVIPIFTPPWNRLSPATLKILRELGFCGVSLSDPLPRGSRSNSQLLNLRVHIDLHTRKASNGDSDYELLLRQLGSQLARKEPLGIMVHHKCMTLFAFEFLHALIHLLRLSYHTTFLGFRDLIPNPT